MKTEQGMTIEWLAIEDLILDPSNARMHNDKNLEAIKGSLARFGQQKPIVIGKENVIIAGNGTLQAAKALKWEKIQVVRTDLRGTELTAFGLADNRSSELATWNSDVLGQLLHSLREEDFPLPDIGFDTSYLDAFNEPDDQQFEFKDPGEDNIANPNNKLVLTIAFEDEDSQQQLFLELKDRGFRVKI